MSRFTEHLFAGLAVAAVMAALILVTGMIWWLARLFLGEPFATSAVVAIFLFGLAAAVIDWITER